MPGTRSSYITYTWVPDPVVFADSIFAVADAINDFGIPLMYAKERVQADIRQAFETETSPDGDKWKEWADSYKSYAEAYPNAGILRQSGELYQDATGDDAFTVSNDSVFYHAENIPERGIWHQEGRPGRKTKGGKPNPLPKRAFLGVSMVTQGMIFKAFDDWFEGVIRLYPDARRGGGLVQRHSKRDRLGRFTPR